MKSYALQTDSIIITNGAVNIPVWSLLYSDGSDFTLLGLSPLVDMLGLPERNWNEGFVRARQRRRWGTHGCPALGVGSTVEPRKYGWAVPSPRGARRGSVTCRQRLGFWFVLHGLHLILLCAAPEAMQKDGHRSPKLSDQVLYQRFPGKIEQQQ